jgi:hypothetical protein
MAVSDGLMGPLLFSKSCGVPFRNVVVWPTGPPAGHRIAPLVPKTPRQGCRFIQTVRKAARWSCAKRNSTGKIRQGGRILPLTACNAVIYVRNPAPRGRPNSAELRNSVVKLRNSIAGVRTATPTVRTATPTVRTAAPAVRTAAPAVRTAAPLVRTNEPFVRNPAGVLREKKALLGAATGAVRAAGCRVRFAPRRAGRVIHAGGWSAPAVRAGWGGVGEKPALDKRRPQSV